MPAVDLICLANSYKWSRRCVAGLRVDGGGWVRPVSDQEHGELQYNQYRLPDHTEPRLLDVIRVGLTNRRPLPHQPENWLIDDSPWALLERPAAAEHAPVVAAAVLRDSLLFGNPGRSVPYAQFRGRSARESLALVQPTSIRWHTEFNTYELRNMPRVAFQLGALFLLASNALAGTPTPAKFAARRDYGPGAQLVRAADVNGDKIPDLVEITSNGNGLVTTLLGTGNGTFSTGPSSGIGFEFVEGMAVLDVNGDGIIDLLVSGTTISGSSGIGVCLGNGDGTFQLPIVYAVSDSNIQDLAVGDFNADGNQDIVIAGNSGIWLFLSKGGGVFNPGVLTAAPSGWINGVGGGRLAVADFNGDGHLDVAMSYNGSVPSSPAGFALLFGNGDGTFQPAVSHQIPPRGAENYIAIGDLNRDGHPDIVLSPLSVNANYVNVLLNNGKGQFATPVQVTMGSAIEIAVGDVNGDGFPDIVNATGTIVLGVGKGQFGTPITYAVENSQFPKDVILAQLHKAGTLDIVAAQYQGVSVLLNEGGGVFEDGEWISVPGAGNCAAAADFNKDGKPDLAVPTSNGIVILLGTGMASSPYTVGATIPLSSPGCPIAGDINRDGNPDILVGAGSLNGVGAYLGNGDGTFTLASTTAVGPGLIVFGDFNHDGKVDFADSTNQLALGNGDGTFQTPVSFVPNPAPLGYSWIAAGDINNDGWTDILLAAADTFGYFAVLVNNKQGGFTQTNVTDEAGPQGIVLADVNKDGNLDAVIWPVGLNNAQIYLGDGKGDFTLQTQTPSYPGLDTIMLSVGDVNGDGIPDLLLPASGTLGIAYGNGDGTFQPTVGWGLGGSPGQILLENLHGQAASSHLPDIVSPDSGGGVTVLLNITK